MKALNAIWQFIKDFGLTIALLITLIVLAYICYTL
jgi:hypothetical protein